MSKLGIQSVKYSKMDENGKYTGAKEIGTLVTFNGTPNKQSVEDWGDNRAVESNKSVNKIALSMELNDLAGAEYADLCGHEYDEKKKLVTVRSTDNAPYVGIGAIGNSERNGKEVFILKFYTKMQFGDPTDENSTETETKAYKHTTIEGDGYPNDDKVLKLEQEFETLQEAVTALDELLAATAAEQSVEENQEE